MSTTLKYSNGDIDIDRVTGRPRLVSGVEKCGQDVANVLMTELKQASAEVAAFGRQYGSELASINTPPMFSGFVGRPFVARKIQEAIQRLMDAQQADPNVTADERIIAIDQLIVEAISETDYVFFVQVRVASGSTTPPITNLTLTKLDHQFPPSSAVDTRVF